MKRIYIVLAINAVFFIGFLFLIWGGFDIRIMVTLLLFVETVRSLKDSIQNAINIETTADFEKLIKKTLKDCKNK